MVKVYLKSEDIAKDIKATYKNLNLAWVHIEYQEILNELYNLGWISFDIVGKKNNIEGFEFTNKNFQKIYFDISSKYFNTLKEICNKFVYIIYEKNKGYFVSIINEHKNEKNNICYRIKIKLCENEFNFFNEYEVSLLKSDFEICDIKKDSIIPVLRQKDNNDSVKLNYEEFKNLYLEKLNKNLNNIDYGIIEKIEIEYHKYFNENLYTIYYSYKGFTGHKFAILNYLRAEFGICKFKAGDKIYLKLSDKGFRVWDNKKQLQILKESNN